MRDGEAVAAVRELLRDDGVPTGVPWRSTVETVAEAEWVVRTWTSTPAAAARPTGSPQYVHRVRQAGGGVEIERVG